MSLSPGLLTLCLKHRAIISIYFKGVLLLLLLISLFQQMPCLTDGGKCSISKSFPLCPVHCNAKNSWGKKMLSKNRCNQSLGAFTRTNFHFRNMHSMCYFFTYLPWKTFCAADCLQEWSIRWVHTENSWKTLNWHFYTDFLRFVVCFVHM